jgi:hypothetical protein
MSLHVRFDKPEKAMLKLRYVSGGVSAFPSAVSCETALWLLNRMQMKVDTQPFLAIRLYPNASSKGQQWIHANA